jgi:hypothetical protein
VAPVKLPSIYITPQTDSAASAFPAKAVRFLKATQAAANNGKAEADAALGITAVVLSFWLPTNVVKVAAVPQQEPAS